MDVVASGARCIARARTNDTHHVRRNRVVLTPRRWRQVWRDDSSSDGGKKARSPRRARYKPLNHCAGNAGCFGEPVVTNSCAFPIRTRGCGCIVRPAFPAPSFLLGGRLLHPLGISCCENAEACLVRLSKHTVIAGQGNEALLRADVPAMTTWRIQRVMTSRLAGRGDAGCTLRKPCNVIVLRGRPKAQPKQNERGEVVDYRCCRRPSFLSCCAP
jgi:hypothetical protein